MTAARPKIFPGVIPAAMTPFARDGLALDEGGLRRNLAHLRENGIEQVVACGTMGEAGSLTESERQRVIAIAGEAMDEAGGVVVGISASSAGEAASRARQAVALGARGLMCLPPVTYRVDEREALAFFEEVAAATDLPIMLYNNPEASRSDLGPELIARIVAEVDGVVAVKECSGDARRIASLLALTNGAVEVLVGGDDWALEGFCAGATGWISGCASIAPAECVRLFELCRSADLARARDVYNRLLPLARLDMEPKLVQYFKAALDRQGLAGGATRPPRLGLRAEEHTRVEAALAALGGTA